MEKSSWNEKDLETVKKAAALSGMKLSTFIKKAAIEKAIQLIKKLIKGK